MREIRDGSFEKVKASVSSKNNLSRKLTLHLFIHNYKLTYVAGVDASFINF